MRKTRKGIALIAALGGIVVMGALIAGVFFVSTQEHRIGGGNIVQERAFRAAETGLNTSLASWDNVVMSALPIGGVAVQTYSNSSEGWVDTVRITRLSIRGYSILSTATAGSSSQAQSRKRTLLNVRLTAPTFDFLGALTVSGDTKLGGSSSINGFNTNPADWASCPVPAGAMPGVAIPNAADIQYAGCGDCVNGTPDVLETAEAADTSTYFKFGDEDWASLTSAATKVFDAPTTLNGIQPSVLNGACNTSVLTNWGAPDHTTPANACENYFPVIHARGENGVFKLTGGMGQGILLVDGDLEISGGFEFFGPVIVRGRLKTTGNGTLWGGVMAANVDLEENVVLGNATVNYSKCAIDKAIAGSTNPRRVVQRAWTEIY